MTLAHAVTGTGEYEGVAAASVTVTIDEVDTAAVSIDPTALTVAEGDAGGASYSVVLGSEPTAEVTVEISGHVGTDLSLSGPTLSATNSLTFTPANWSAAQTVTVTAARDPDAATMIL